MNDAAHGAGCTGEAGAWLDRDCIAYHAERRAQRTACVDLATGRAWSYAGLDAEIARCAAHLAAAYAPGARIAILARNAIQHVLLLYATARAGMVFAPLNWRLPAAELKTLLADAEPALLIVSPEFADAAAQAAASASVGEVRAIAELSWTEASTSQLRPLGADAPWVLLYTSGTTGRPKGVIITRRTGFFSAYNFRSAGDVSAESVALGDAPFFHTVGLMAVLHSTLSAGGTVRIAERFLPGETIRMLRDPELGISHYFGVPQMAQAIVDHPDYGQAPGFPTLKGFFSGGAPLPAPLAQALAADGVPICNGYGSSEAGTIMHVPLGVPVAPEALTSCGVATPAMQVRLVGTDDVDVAPGEVGEVWLRGPAVTPGYWRQPEATQAAFRDGWFRTGDAARRDEAGFYHLVDRWKDMYISGGENVYPAEVEAALLEIEGIAEAAVVGAPDPRWGETGFAFVVLKAGASLDAASVDRFCRGRLAGYKRPAGVHFLDELPRTGSGKVRKDALRARLAPLLRQP